MSVGLVREHGDFGLGTFEDLDGEMVVLDGHVFRVSSDGDVHEVPDDATTPFAVVTRSEKGCLVLSPDGVLAVPASPVERVVDTTGAGDLFAAGFLFGLAQGVGHERAARLGTLAAAEVIQHLGARPQASLKALAQERGLLA